MDFYHMNGRHNGFSAKELEIYARSFETLEEVNDHLQRVLELLKTSAGNEVMAHQLFKVLLHLKSKFGKRVSSV